MATNPFLPRRHSSEGSPAWMQVVERRLEQAAEESRRGGRGGEGGKVYPMAHSVVVPVVVIPALREWLV